MKNESRQIYDFGFIEALFDQMSGSYERVNYITSFGFSKRWRRQFVKNAHIQPGAVILDLMTGMGECWQASLKAAGPAGKLIAIDFSAGMLRLAQKRKQKLPGHDIQIHKRNVFENGLADESVDCVISGFGLKTLSAPQTAQFAQEIHRLLKPGGTFSLIEVSVPTPRLLRALYMFYLKRMIPLLGRLMLGNPDNYRMLGVYTEKFGNAAAAQQIFEAQGLEVAFIPYFYGTASGLIGRKRDAS